MFGAAEYWPIIDDAIRQAVRTLALQPQSALQSASLNTHAGVGAWRRRETSHRQLDQLLAPHVLLLALTRPSQRRNCVGPSARQVTRRSRRALRPSSHAPPRSISIRLFNVPADPSGSAPYTRVNHAKFMVSEQVRLPALSVVDCKRLRCRR